MKIRARAEGCHQPDVLGNDLVGAITQVEVNEIGEAGHQSQHRQKARTQESLVGKKKCLSEVSQWMVRSREAQGLFIQRSWLRWGRQMDTEAGQGVYHFHLEIKCDFFSSSLNIIYIYRQFKKIVSIIYVLCSAVVQGIVSTWEIVSVFYFLSGITNSTSDQTHVTI